jgi:hypothetical protein
VGVTWKTGVYSLIIGLLDVGWSCAAGISFELDAL